MTPASVAIILGRVETVDVNDPSLIGWEPITDDLDPTEENRKTLAGAVLDCNGMWNSQPIPHRIVQTGDKLALWTVPAAPDIYEGLKPPKAPDRTPRYRPAPPPPPQPDPEPEPLPPTPPPQTEHEMKLLQLQAIAAQSAENLLALLAEREDDIIATISELTEEANENGDEKLVFTINHTLKLDILRKSQNDSIAFSIKRKSEITNVTPDPEQPELPAVAGAGKSRKPKGAVASLIDTMRRTVGPGGSVSITDQNTGKGVKIEADNITRIDGKETANHE